MTVALGRRRLLASTVGGALGGVQAAVAAAWPDHPVRVLIGSAPGGPGESFRLIAGPLQRALGQPFVLENRPGATGALAAQAAVRAPADGYTLLYTANSYHVINPLVRPEVVGFDPVRAFRPITLTVRYPFFLFVNPRLPVHSVQDLVDYALARPGQLNFSTLGAASGGHLVTELFMQKTGINATHVPFQGAAPSVMSVVNGDTQFCFDTFGPAGGLAAEGKLRGLAVTGTDRLQAAPQFPTMTEAGFTGFEAAELWLGLMAPAGTPDQVVETMNRETRKALDIPEVQQRLRALSYEPSGGTPEQFNARLVADRQLWAQVGRAAGLLR